MRESEADRIQAEYRRARRLGQQAMKRAVLKALRGLQDRVARQIKNRMALKKPVSNMVTESGAIDDAITVVKRIRA